jgi:hypothetical protein
VHNYKNIINLLPNEIMEIILLYTGDCKIINTLYVYYPNLLKNYKILNNNKCNSFVCRIHDKTPSELLYEYANNRNKYVNNIMNVLAKGKKVKINGIEYILINGKLINDKNQIATLDIKFVSTCESCNHARTGCPVLKKHRGKPWILDNSDGMYEDDDIGYALLRRKSFFQQKNNARDIIMMLLYNIFEVYFIKFVDYALSKIDNDIIDTVTNLKYLIYQRQYFQIIKYLHGAFRYENIGSSYYIEKFNDKTISVVAESYAYIYIADKYDDCIFDVICDIKYIKKNNVLNKFKSKPTLVIDKGNLYNYKQKFDTGEYHAIFRENEIYYEGYKYD